MGNYFLYNLFHPRYSSSVGCLNSSDAAYAQDKLKPARYLEIPLQSEELEIPTFALETFKELTLQEKPLPDALVVQLYSQGLCSDYKTFNKNIETVLQTSFTRDSLVHLYGKEADKTISYYAAKGAIFNEHFQPLVMTSWKLKGKPNNDASKLTHRQWSVIKLLVRIDPSFYLQKPDNVHRYILKKLIPSLLEQGVDKSDLAYNVFRDLKPAPEREAPSIVIESCPFPTRTPDKPSIETSNDMLIKTVLDNIDDFI